VSRLTDDREHELGPPARDEDYAPEHDGSDDLFPSRSEHPDDELRDYQPIHPRGFDWGGFLRRLWAPIAVAAGLLLKFGFFIFKFFGIFIAVGGYTLIWGWRFAVGFVLLLLVHELGHFVEARLQGLKPSLPVFIPFLGAYVTVKDMPNDPWRVAKISLAGPIAGGLASAACYAASAPMNSDLLSALAFTGFLLNLFNLIPVLFLDGGAIWRCYGSLKAARDPRAYAVLALYLGTAAALALGMWASHVPQSRL
jgi:Zn-dependent protease